MRWIKKWLRNKEIARLEAELDYAVTACRKVYDFCWEGGNWRGNVNMEGILAAVQQAKYVALEAQDKETQQSMKACR